MAIRQGRYTLNLTTRPSIIGNAAVVGKTEGEGPLKAEFDHIYTDDSLGEASFEKAESTLQREAVIRALDKAGKVPSDVDYILAGDLLNQCTGSSFGLRDLGIPFLGLYGACSTMSLALGLASLLVDTKAASGSRWRRPPPTSVRRSGSFASRWNTAGSGRPQHSVPQRRRVRA